MARSASGSVKPQVVDVADILGADTQPLVDEVDAAPIAEDEQAHAAGADDPESEIDPTNVPSGGETILIHFLEDGFTALGKVWYRGQELEFAPGCQAYKDTIDRNGDTWLNVRGDDMAQIERWGKVMFRPGPWPGKPLIAAAEATYEPLKPLKPGQSLSPSVDELRRAQEQAARNRAAPRLPIR